MEHQLLMSTTSLDQEVKAVQAEHPGWTYERSLALAVCARENSQMGKDPKLAKELARHGKQEKALGANNSDLHTERLVAIRKLRAQNPKLTFDQAFVQVLALGKPSS